MRMKTRLALSLLVACFVAAPAAADAVIDLYGTKLTLFSDHKGSAKVSEINRGDIKLPASVRSKTSPYGLIRVRFQFKEPGREPVTGWVFKSYLKIDKNVEIDVPGCGSPSQNVATVSRGMRGLGSGCK